MVTANIKQPLVSIVSVVLNGASTLERAIRSVVDQDLNDCEYIIIDGQSTDGSIDIIKKFESKLTFWISERDEGIYDAMNKAISYTRGKWVYFLGSDDQLLDGFKTAITFLQDEKTLYYCNVYRPALDKVYDGEFSLYKLACRNICHQSIFYPRFIWKKYSYNLKYKILADYELNLRCFTDADVKLQFLPVTIAIFSDKGGVSPKIKDIEFEKDKMSLIKRDFPSSIFVVSCFRAFLLKLLIGIKIEKIAVKIYRFFQKI